MRHASELELLDLIEKCPTCRDRQVHASAGDKFGVVITWEGAQVGIWGWIDNALRFRTFANWEPRITAADTETALAATIKMAEARKWMC
jgi:hypothetical protein